MLTIQLASWIGNVDELVQIVQQVNPLGRGR